MSILKGRYTAMPQEPFVVFIIGMRINQWWKVHRWLPVLMAMGPMLKELHMHRELGFLGVQSWFSRTILLVQYWRSVEDLNAYAKNRDNKHLPAWAAFNKATAGSGAVGVYHETYAIQPGQFENVYVDMPRTLLGRVVEPVEAKGRLAGAEGRMKRE